MASVFQLSCPPIPQVRIALIGLGDRGMKTLRRYAYIHHAVIKYVVDLSETNARKANEALRLSGRPEAGVLVGDDAWQRACRLPDVDLIYICTEWRLHAAMSIYAMQCGKHVAVEVPAATTVDECHALVRTAEETQRHLFMTENCCYDLFTLQTLQLVRQGRLGRLCHLEGAYIHRLTEPSTALTPRSATRQAWMQYSFMEHGGNPYPTHAVGPIARLLGIHRGDRFVSICSLTAKGERVNGLSIGRISNSLLTTESGCTVLLQLDVTTPRPYSRMQTVCGTKGYVQKYPVPIVQLSTDHENAADHADGEPDIPAEAMVGEAAEAFMRSYCSDSSAVRLWFEGKAMGVPNEMNYTMDARLIECLRNGSPLDIDVYDAAEWSCLAELSQRSAAQGGVPVEVPVFYHP